MNAGLVIFLANLPALCLLAASLWLIGTGHSYWAAAFFFAGLIILHSVRGDEK